MVRYYSKMDHIIFSCDEVLEDPCMQDPADPAFHEKDCGMFVTDTRNVVVPSAASTRPALPSVDSVGSIANDSGFDDCILDASATLPYNSSVTTLLKRNSSIK